MGKDWTGYAIGISRLRRPVNVRLARNFPVDPGGLATGTLTDPNTLFIALMNPGDKSTTTTMMALSMTLHRQK
jgi:secreted PhoX family phosphatase